MMAESPDPTKKGNLKLSPQSVADRSAKDSRIGPLMQIQGLSKDGSLDILLDERLGQEWEMRIGEFDPAIVFNWSEALPLAMATINENQPPLPIWVPVGTQYPLSLEQLKLLVLSYCQDGVTTGTIVERLCLAPNTLEEYGRVIGRMQFLQLDPFFIYLADSCGDYIARIFLFHDSKPRVTARPLHLSRPEYLPPQHVQAFV